MHGPGTTAHELEATLDKADWLEKVTKLLRNGDGLGPSDDVPALLALPREEIVDRLDAPPNAVVLPHWVVSAVCEVKGGAFPSYAQDYYPRSNAFYKQWDVVSRERDSFTAWIERHVMGTADFAAFRRSIEQGAHV